MPAWTAENEAWYGPWPPVDTCRERGHNWGGHAEPGPNGYPITPFPAEGERQTCPVCGCVRLTEDGRMRYLAPRGT